MSIIVAMASFYPGCYKSIFGTSILASMLRFSRAARLLSAIG